MAKKKKGFFESLINDMVYHGLMEAARDPATGKVDPYAAAGIAFGSGKMKTFSDQMRLGARLGAAGAFDSDDDNDWRLFCEDGSDYGIDPFDYSSEYDYDVALEHAKYGWRESCEEGIEHGVNPDLFETKEEYEEALHEAKYGWRDTCEDGTIYGVDPDDYETQEDYDQALEEAKYGWRDTCEDGSEYGIEPEHYETEEGYNAALEEAKYGWRDTCDDGFASGIDPEDYETESEYTEALLAAKYAWRDTCQYDPDVDVDPDDYETEEEYDAAIEEAHEQIESDDVDDDDDEIDAGESSKTVDANSTMLSFTLKVSYPGQEALEAIKKSDYPNIRLYNAAYHLCDLKQGTAILSDDSCRDTEIQKCEFILSRSCVAAQYLTVFDGYLYTQAVKDHFSLPVDFPDEDEEVITCFDDMFLEIAEHDVRLAVKIWCWCVKEFGPYQQYMKHEWTLYDGILASSDDYPDGFMDVAVGLLSDDAVFRHELLENSPSFPYSIEAYIVHSLSTGKYAEAKVLFQSAMSNPKAKGKDREDLVDRVISGCANWEELETMERFKIHLLPVLHSVSERRLQRLIPKIEKRVEEYIAEVEQSEERYQYSRRYAWRKSCVDGSQYGLDPLDYETEAEYKLAIDKEKYAWRSMYVSEAEEYGLSVCEYETEELFSIALESAANQRNATFSQSNDQTNVQSEVAGDTNIVIDQTNETEAGVVVPSSLMEAQCNGDQKLAEVERKPRSIPWRDPLISSDKSVYIFCGVLFPHGNSIYHYLTTDDSLEVGEYVVVPVGNNGQEVVCEVATIEKHRRATAPYPVDRAKHVLRRASEQDNMGIHTEAGTDNTETPGNQPLTGAEYAVSDGITDMLLSKGLCYEDNRPKKGRIWVYDCPSAGDTLRQIEIRFGVRFVFVKKGGKATMGKAAWYMV